MFQSHFWYPCSHCQQKNQTYSQWGLVFTRVVNVCNFYAIKHWSSTCPGIMNNTSKYKAIVLSWKRAEYPLWVWEELLCKQKTWSIKLLFFFDRWTSQTSWGVRQLLKMKLCQIQWGCIFSACFFFSSNSSIIKTILVPSMLFSTDKYGGLFNWSFQSVSGSPQGTFCMDIQVTSLCSETSANVYSDIFVKVQTNAMVSEKPSEWIGKRA